MPTRKRYYAHLLITEKKLSEDILEGVYAMKFATEMHKLIKQEVAVYTSKMKGQNTFLNTLK